MTTQQNDVVFESADDVQPLDVNGFEARLCHATTKAGSMNPKVTAGHMHFTFADTSGKLSLDGKEVGEICATFGGTLVLRDKETGTQWHIDATPIFAAFQEAIEARLETHGTVLIPKEDPCSKK